MPFLHFNFTNSFPELLDGSMRIDLSLHVTSEGVTHKKMLADGINAVGVTKP